jgi:hypothetical protein
MIEMLAAVLFITFGVSFVLIGGVIALIDRLRDRW